jgi:hypothetical protein
MLFPGGLAGLWSDKAVPWWKRRKSRESKQAFIVAQVKDEAAPKVPPPAVDVPSDRERITGTVVPVGRTN